MQGDQVGDLTADRRDPDLQPCFASASQADRPSTSPAQALDAVQSTELVNMGVEVAHAFHRSRRGGERRQVRADMATSAELVPDRIVIACTSP
jgi:hypothetical protein